MNEKEIKETLEQVKEVFKGRYPSANEEDIEHMILDLFFNAYCEGKIDRDDLTTLTNALGYEVEEDILDQIEKEKGETI